MPAPHTHIAGCPSPRRPAGLRLQAGQTLPLVVVFMLILLVFCGLVIDLGNAYRVQQSLQASADAAAAGGAGQLTMAYPPDSASATQTAEQFGSETGGKNPIGGVPAADVTENVSVSCQAQFGFNCTAGYPNTVTVDETAHVPTFLLGLVGYSSIAVSAHSQACSPCGGQPLDVIIILDRTGSMGQDNKLANAKAGVQAFLSTMDPSIDDVGLVLVPPAPTPSQGCTDVINPYFPTPYTGQGGTYSLANPGYVVVPLSNDYATSVGNLNNSSPLLTTINCVKAGGSTAYAAAIDAANAELQQDGRPGTQKVIVFLSDGAANDSSDTLPSTSPYRTNPCGQAVSSAAAAKADNVLMYSIAYTAAGDDCYAAVGAKVNGKTVKSYLTTLESPSIGAEQTLQEIASPGSQYFYDLPTPTSLVGIFQQIAADISAGSSRIVD